MDKGDYVFATKYADGDPADGWAVGFFNGLLQRPSGADSSRFMVVNENGVNFRGNGYRRIASILSEEAGKKILDYCMQFEYPNWPSNLNLWDEVTPMLINKS